MVVGLVLVLVMAIALTACTDEAGPSELGEVQVVAADGATETVDLGELTAYEGQGGFKKSTGTMVGPSSYKGAKLSDVIAAAGDGMGDSAGVQVVAKDGYALTLSLAQLDGGVMTYTPEGEALSLGGVTAVLAYEQDGEAPFDGGPRLVFVSEQGAWTDGHFWIKEVDAIKFVASVDDWSISMSGVESVTLDRATFESMVTCGTTPHPAIEYEMTEKDGSTTVYAGAPLWLLLSMVDGGDAPGGHYEFNDAAAEAGYTVSVVAADGFAAEFEASRVARTSDILVAYMADGEPLGGEDGPLKLVGDGLTSGKERIKQIAEIKIEGIK